MTPEELAAIEARAEIPPNEIGRDPRGYIENRPGYYSKEFAESFAGPYRDDVLALCAALREAWAERDLAEALAAAGAEMLGHISRDRTELDEIDRLRAALEQAIDVVPPEDMEAFRNHLSEGGSWTMLAQRARDWIHEHLMRRFGGLLRGEP